jgi:outer membrane protein assembly factor BamE (lipoprotein component of BamABCDE complex)
MNPEVALIAILMFAAVACERWPQLPVVLWERLRKVGWPIAKALILATAGLGAFFLLNVILFYPHSEAYCFFNPSIDTRYAAGYSEKAFDKIENGMTMEEVRRLLGTPLYEIPNDNGTEEWGYTLDGKCGWGDWAWLGRMVVFRDGKVEKTVKHVFYD